MIPSLLTAAILFVSTFTRAALGFGDAVLAMPLLALAVGMQTATPLVAFTASTIALLIVWRNWRSIDLRATRQLILASLAGIPIGLYLLKSAPEGLMKGILGGIILIYGLYSLVRPDLRLARDRLGLAYLFGFLAGILGGAYNTNGPPVVIYATLRRWDPALFRATLQGYFLPTGLCILIGHGLAGLWTREVLNLYALSLPAVLLALYLGNRFNRTVPKGKFDRYVYLALVGMGGLLILGSAGLI